MINIVDIIIEWYYYSKYIIGLFTTLIFIFTLFMAYSAESNKQAEGAKYAKVLYWEWTKDTHEYFIKKFNLGVLHKDIKKTYHYDIDIGTLLYARDYYSKQVDIAEEKIKPVYRYHSKNSLLLKVRMWDYLGEPSPTSGYGSRLIFNEISRSYYSRHMQNESYFAHPVYYDHYCPIYFTIYPIYIRERDRIYSFEDRGFFERLEMRTLFPY